MYPSTLQGLHGHDKVSSTVFSVRTSVCRVLPLELEGRADEEELEVSIEDMKDEMYVPKKKTFLPFSGRGYRLGR